MIDKDFLQGFLFEDKGIRGQLVHLTTSYQAAKQNKTYPFQVGQQLGQALTASVLLSSTLKYEGSLILQIQSDGPITSLVAQCNHLLHIRGLAKWREDNLPDNLNTALLGNGQLAITIMPDKTTEQYQGIVSLQGEENIATSIETYFNQSEQLPTRLWLTADEHVASGLLLQQMPGHFPNHERDWEHVLYLADTMTAQELLTLANEELLFRLFNQENIRLFDLKPVCFRCRCTIEKMEQALMMYGKEEIDEILSTNRFVEVTCEFCNRSFEFDKVDVERIFHTSSSQ